MHRKFYHRFWRFNLGKRWIHFPILIILNLLCWFFFLSAKSIPPIELKIMTYNVRHGTSFYKEPNIKQQAEIIKKISPNFVGLQEIDKGCLRSGKIDQTKLFSELTGLDGTFGSFMDYDSGKYGMAILSNLKIDKTFELELPDGAEPRIALIQVVSINEHAKVAFVNVHFDWTDEYLRYLQAKVLIYKLNNLDIPAIIIGDFNTVPFSEVYYLFKNHDFNFTRKTGNVYTYSAKHPLEEIDHIVYRDSKNIKITFGDVVVLNEPSASDHRPVVATIKIETFGVRE